MAGRGVTMQVDGAGHFQNAMQLNKARSHHGKVSHHVAVPEKRFERLHDLGDAPTRFHHFLLGSFGFDVPFPSVFKSSDLRTGTAAVLLRKKDVVVLATINGGSR